MHGVRDAVHGVRGAGVMGGECVHTSIGPSGEGTGTAAPTVLVSWDGIGERERGDSERGVVGKCSCGDEEPDEGWCIYTVGGGGVMARCGGVTIWGGGGVEGLWRTGVFCWRGEGDL